jgi:hypothetical protein
MRRQLLLMLSVLCISPAMAEECQAPTDAQIRTAATPMLLNLHKLSVTATTIVYGSASIGENVASCVALVALKRELIERELRRRNQKFEPFGH